MLSQCLDFFEHPHETYTLLTFIANLAVISHRGGQALAFGFIFRAGISFNGSFFEMQQNQRLQLIRDCESIIQSG